METWWNSLSGLQQILYCAALPATLLLIVQTLLTLFGLGGHGADTDTDTADFSGGVDTDGDGVPDLFPDADDVSHETVHDDGLRPLTLRGIIALLSVGSWTGIALLDAGVGETVSLLLAAAAGVAALFAVALLMRLAARMQQDGTLDPRNAVGKEGTVYLRIPEQGCGKVTVIVQERAAEFEARSRSGEIIPTGSRIRVVASAGDGSLTVEPLRDEPEGMNTKEEQTV